MSNDLYLLITMLRKEDMELRTYFHQCKNDTYFGQNYMYWGEEDVYKLYLELFDNDKEVVILKVEKINGVK